MKHRLLRERWMVGALAMTTLASCFFLAVILAMMFWRGWPAINWDFLSGESKDFGREGGILFQALGTLLLMTGAAGISLPVALGSALFQTEFLRPGKLKNPLRVLIYALNGVPTILFGLVGYIVFGIYLQTGVSWVTGCLILAVMILPTLQVSFLEAIEALPRQYREAGMALGLSAGAQIRSIVLPQCFYGIVTGTLLGLARAAGETAAIMFTATAFSGVGLPRGWTDPVPTLQTHILVLAQEAVHPQTIANAWGAGLVLLTLVFVLILASLGLRSRLQWESER